VGSESGNGMIKLQRNIGAVRILRIRIWRNGSSSAPHSDLDVLIPLLFLLRAAIDLENNTVAFECNVRYLSPVASPRCRPILRGHELHLLLAGRDHAILDGQSLGSHRKDTANKNELGVESANQGETVLRAYRSV